MKKIIYLFAIAVFASCTTNTTTVYPRVLLFDEISEEHLVNCSEETKAEVLADIAAIKLCHEELNIFEDWLKNADEEAVRQYQKTRKINGKKAIVELESLCKGTLNGDLIKLSSKYSKRYLVDTFNVPEEVVRAINAKIDNERTRKGHIYVKLKTQF